MIQVTVETSGLTEALALLIATQKQVARAHLNSTNSTATKGRKMVADDLHQATGVSKRLINSATRISRARPSRPFAKLQGTGKRIPTIAFRHVVHQVDPTRAYVQVHDRLDGSLSNAWGFVNPLGKRQAHLARYPSKPKVLEFAKHPIRPAFGQEIGDPEFQAALLDILGDEFVSKLFAQLRR